MTREETYLISHFCQRNRMALTSETFQSYFESMKEISIKIDDELYRRASRRAGDLEAEVNHHMTEYLEALNSDDDAISVTRTHMADLFKATRNFGVGVGPSREEMHEHGSIEPGNNHEHFDYNSPRT